MEDDVSLGRLKVLSLLLEVGSLTQTAQILGMSQPSVSKVRRARSDPRGPAVSPL